jgi:hypothetical protein
MWLKEGHVSGTDFKAWSQALALKSNPSFLFRLASQGVAYLLFLTVLT